MGLYSNLQLIYFIIISLTGFIGNATTIFVFSQRRLRSLRSSFFLTCLAITDLVFILILIIVVFNTFNVPLMTKPVCITTIYLSHIASFLSSNFTLAYTLHRLLVVFLPIHATRFLTQRTNRIVAFGLFLFACSFYSISFHVTKTTLISNTTNTVSCQEDENHALLFPFLIIDTLLTFIIPCSLITFMNLAIVYKLQRQLTRKLNLIKLNSTIPISNPSINSLGHLITDGTQKSQSNSVNNIAIESSRLLQQTQKENRCFLDVRPIYRIKTLNTCSRQSRTTLSTKTTRMLLIASTVFLVFNLPYHFFLFCFLFIQHRPLWMIEAVNLARFWFFASFCVNFFVYAICGKRFRDEVIRLFQCSSMQRYFRKPTRQNSFNRQDSAYLK